MLPIDPRSARLISEKPWTPFASPAVSEYRQQAANCRARAEAAAGFDGFDLDQAAQEAERIERSREHERM